MDLSQHLQQIQRNFDDQQSEYEQQISELKEAHAQEIAAYKVIENGAIIQVIEEAKSENISVGAWLLNAITDALYSPKGSHIKIRNSVYEKLVSLAKSRGQELDDLTCRDGLSEVILTALLNRRI